MPLSRLGWLAGTRRRQDKTGGARRRRNKGPERRAVARTTPADAQAKVLKRLDAKQGRVGIRLLVGERYLQSGGVSRLLQLSRGRRRRTETWYRLGVRLSSARPRRRSIASVPTSRKSDWLASRETVKSERSSVPRAMPSSRPTTTGKPPCAGRKAAKLTICGSLRGRVDLLGLLGCVG
jgi:hypothetical protein